MSCSAVPYSGNSVFIDTVITLHDTLISKNNLKKKYSEFALFSGIYNKIITLFARNPVQKPKEKHLQSATIDSTGRSMQTTPARELSINEIYAQVMSDTMPSPYQLNENHELGEMSDSVVPLGLDGIDTVSSDTTSDISQNHKAIYGSTGVGNKAESEKVVLGYSTSSTGGKVQNGNDEKSADVNAENSVEIPGTKPATKIKEKAISGNFFSNFFSKLLEALSEFRSKVRKMLGFSDE